MCSILSFTVCISNGRYHRDKLTQRNMYSFLSGGLLREGVDDKRQCRCSVCVLFPVKISTGDSVSSNYTTSARNQCELVMVWLWQSWQKTVSKNNSNRKVGHQKCERVCHSAIGYAPCEIVHMGLFKINRGIVIGGVKVGS